MLQTGALRQDKSDDGAGQYEQSSELRIVSLSLQAVSLIFSSTHIYS